MHVPSPRARTAAAALLALTALLTACTNYDPRGESNPGNPMDESTPIPTATPPGPIGSAQIVLTVATLDHVTVGITDESGTLTAATSGTPGDGASVEAERLAVANLTPMRLRLTWLGGPCDAANTLSIDAARRRLLLVQRECPGDAIATDRMLDLTFSTPVKAADLEAFLQDGLDT